MNNLISKGNRRGIYGVLQLVQLGIFVLGGLLVACEPQTKASSTAPKCNCWLDELAARDTLFLTVTSAGCFHYHREHMKIYQGADSLEASFTAWLPDSNGQVGPIVRPFSTEAKFILADLMKKGGGYETHNRCTDVDSFQIKFKNELLTFIDADCELREYHALKSSLLTDVDARMVHTVMKVVGIGCCIAANDGKKLGGISKRSSIFR